VGWIKALLLNWEAFNFQVLQRIESFMSATVDPAFKVIPKNSTAFLIWRVEVSDSVLI
jgi:hypothetical protein